MRIKSWQKFNESNEYSGPKFIHDLLLDPFIDDELCEAIGGDKFMRFEFKKESDFNEAKETIEAWDIEGWTTYDEHADTFMSSYYIIAWDKSSEDFLVNKLSECEVVSTDKIGLKYEWIKDDVVMAKLTKLDKTLYLEYHEIWSFYNNLINITYREKSLYMGAFIKYVFAKYFPSEEYTKMVLDTESMEVFAF
jgi:hypothetical protein